MVQIQQFLKSNQGFQNEKSLPLLNSLFIEQFSKFSPNSPDNTFKTFMKWARRSPELIGFLDVIATDMLSDEINFFPIDKEGSEEKVKNAEAFWELNQGKEVAQETLYDLLLNGIGYNWLGKISDNQLKEFCESAIKETMPEIKEGQLEFKAEGMVKILKKEQSDKIAKKLRHVAARTMSKNNDQFET